MSTAEDKPDCRYVSQLDNCPSCGAEWAYFTEGARYSRIVGIYSREQDRTVEWMCPGCGDRWDRSATVDNTTPTDGAA